MTERPKRPEEIYPVAHVRLMDWAEWRDIAFASYAYPPETPLYRVAREGAGASAATQPGMTPPEQAADKYARIRSTEAAVRQLPPPWRVVIAMRYESNITSISEMARLQNIDRKHARGRLLDALEFVDSCRNMRVDNVGPTVVA